MDIVGLFIFDPLVKRVRRMARIEKELIEITAKKRKLESDALVLTAEHEELRRQAKSIKKKGSPE
jgi:hypothetical protein